MQKVISLMHDEPRFLVATVIIIVRTEFGGNLMDQRHCFCVVRRKKYKKYWRNQKTDQLDYNTGMCKRNSRRQR